MLAALEHLACPKEILEECLRILKPEGMILITTPDISGKKILEFLSFKLGVVSPELMKEHKYYFDSQKLSDLLISSGFKKEKITITKFEFGYNLFAQAFK